MVFGREHDSGWTLTDGGHVVLYLRQRPLAFTPTRRRILKAIADRNAAAFVDGEFHHSCDGESLCSGVRRIAQCVLQAYVLALLPPAK